MFFASETAIPCPRNNHKCLGSDFGRFLLRFAVFFFCIFGSTFSATFLLAFHMLHLLSSRNVFISTSLYLCKIPRQHCEIHDNFVQSVTCGEVNDNLVKSMTILCNQKRQRYVQPVLTVQKNTEMRVSWAWCSVCWHEHVCQFFLKSKLSLSESNISSCWVHDRTRTTFWYAMIEFLICHGFAEKWHFAGVFPRVWDSTGCPRFCDACLHAFTDEMIHNISCRRQVPTGTTFCCSSFWAEQGC